MQSLKDTVMEIKEIVFGNHNIDIEDYIIDLSSRSELDIDDIRNLYNHIALIYESVNKPKMIKGKKTWSKSEDDFILEYMRLSNNSIANNIQDISEVLINRTKQAISFRYYNCIREGDEKSSKREYNKETNKQEYIGEVEKIEEIKENKETRDDYDLIDIVVGIVDNLEKSKIDATILFKSILNLSEKALANNDIELKLKEQEEENKRLKDEIRNLLNDFGTIKEEVSQYSRLNSKEKLQQFNTHNNRVKYIVEKFGNVRID